MESGRLMDRLVVGDVGFGKTEVAFRAMFKAAMDGRQSAILAPTTILARQHYENLRERLERFGIECALLTRMQDAKEIKGYRDIYGNKRKTYSGRLFRKRRKRRNVLCRKPQKGAGDFFSKG